MTLKVFAIRDSKSDVYNTPFFQKTLAEAERSFHQLVNDQQSLVSKYPDDFDLYLIGEYDDNKGLIVSLDTPQHVQKAIMLKVQKDA